MEPQGTHQQALDVLPTVLNKVVRVERQNNVSCIHLIYGTACLYGPVI